MSRGFVGVQAPAATDVELDPSQRVVLGLPDGASAAVLGAPGSGKTTTIVELVRERIRERGDAPGSILVLAATRASANTLRDRLSVRVGVPTNGPLARTVNSLAFQLVRAASGDLEPPVLLTGAEQDQIMAELLQGHIDDDAGPRWPELLGPDVRGLRAFRTELRELHARCVEYGIAPQRLRAIGRSADRPEWVAAADFLQEYADVTDAFRSRSFGSAELVQEAVALVREAEPGEAGAATLGALAGLRTIVVDDAQEVTRSTLALLSQFAARGVAVIAVGDPDLSTGAFHGARADALGRLGHYLDVPVRTVVLDTVHRHGAMVRTLVAAVTARIGAAAAGRQRAAAAVTDGETGSVRAIVAPGSAAQVEVIARTLRERHVFDGVPWNRMSVIVRSGGLVQPLSRGLAALEVPTTVTTAGSALRDENAVRAFVLALEVALGRRSATATDVVELLTGPLGGLDAITLRRLRAALRREELAAGGVRGAAELIVEALAAPTSLLGIDTSTARRAGRLAESLRTASAEAAAGASIEELLWGLWQRSGLERRWSTQAREAGIAADEANRHLDAIVALFAAAQRFVERAPLDPAGLFLDELVGRDVAEDTLAPRAMAEAVTVSTSSGVIGREFDVVVLAGVQENVWPDMRIRGSLLGAGQLVQVIGEGIDDVTDQRAAVLHDELRMFAQAASRTRGELLVTAVRDEDQAPSAFFSLLPAPDEAGTDRHPLSLRGITGRLRRTLTTDRDPQRTRQAASALARLAREKVPGAHPSQWYGLAAASTDRAIHDADESPVRVSPSRMEAFETCELHWLIDRVGGATRNTASSLGSIIHAVAEHAADLDDISPTALLDQVDERWSQLAFESSWQSGIERGRAGEITRRLSAYLRDFRASGGELLAAEGAFSLTVGDAVLNGTVDRVELRAGGVFIVDLKTGSREPITDDGVREHAQLGAYQLAFADGAIDAPDGAELGGARLVIVSSGTAKQDWRSPTQARLDAEELAAFRDRVEHDARRMGGTTFMASVGSHCLDPFSFGSCRIHVVGQVSA